MINGSKQVYCCLMEAWEELEPLVSRHRAERTADPKWDQWNAGLDGSSQSASEAAWISQGDGESQTYHLQKSQISCANVVEVDFDVLPSDLGGVGWHQRLAVCLVVNNIYVKALLSCFIKAVMILPSKQVNPHNAENQPEDKADQQHIHNGRDSANQGVDNHLCWKGWERVSV